MKFESEKTSIILIVLFSFIILGSICYKCVIWGKYGRNKYK